MRNPVRVGREQPVDKADSESDKETEGHADQSRSHSQSAIEVGEALAGVGEWRPDNHRDQHHSSNRSHTTCLRKPAQAERRPFPSGLWLTRPS